MIDKNQNILYVHNDSAGLPQEITDDAGTLVWSARFDAQGNIEKVYADDFYNPLRFQGQYYDPELDLSYNRYRYFDCRISSFINQDPLGLAAGTNVYAYAPNAWGWADPLGLSCDPAKDFSVGDEIAGMKIQNIHQGTNGKVAIIGRSMGNSSMKGVRDAYQDLHTKGYDVEIFDGGVLKGDKLKQFNQAELQFRDATDNWTKRLTNSEVMKLDMFKLNQKWAKELKSQGYTVLDMGDMNNL